MIISRASLLKRAFTKSGLQATPNNAIRNFILTQSVRKHGSWTYRTAAEGVPLKIRIWGQACSGCKFSFNRNLIKILFGRYMPMMCFSPYTYCSYVVVGFLAFILGLWTYYWRVSISRSPSMDRWRARNSTAWSWLNSVWTNRSPEQNERERERNGKIPKLCALLEQLFGYNLLRKHKKLQIQWIQLYFEYVVK